MKITLICIFIFLLASCNSNNQGTIDEMIPLFPAPQSVLVNTEEGYIINPVTGDSIQPMINSLGDTIKTGVPVPAIGNAIHPDSVARPKRLTAGKPEVLSALQNAIKIPESLKVISVDRNSLHTFTPGLDTSSLVLINSTGDTVPTGVPIPIAGKVSPCIQPQPVKALPPRKKDNTSIHMKYLDVDQGMNSSHVLSIVEDRQGNLWFGTGGGGVTMYNGNSFTHFTEKEGLTNNIVWSILEDSHGNLWFGTYGGGVNMYDGKNFTRFTEKEGLSDNHVRTIMEDSQGNLWFGTWNGGVSRYNGETITHFTEKEGLSNYSVNSIIEDSQGNLWFGINGRGAIMFNGKTFTHFTKTEGLSNNYVLSILEDNKGNLWFGTDGGGVVKYNRESFTHFTEKEGLNNNSVRSILEDSHGNLWFGTQYGGLSRYNGESFSHITEKEGLSNNFVNSIFEDRQGNLWIGTEYGGVGIYNGESFTHFTEKEGLNDNRVRSMMEDRQGNLWFGSWHGGVTRYSGGIMAHYSRKEGFTNYSVNTIIKDSQGNLWFGTGGGGVIMHNGKTFTHFTEKEGLSNNNVRSILEDRKGNLWFGTWGAGVTRYNGDTFIHFTEREGLSSNNVRSILEDKQDNLWFGTYGGGVTRLSGGTFTCYTKKEGLSNNIVLSILEDRLGNLWFGTYGGGVCRLIGDTITHYTEKEGLSNNIVQSIQEDNNGNIWISTEKGLNLIVPDRDRMHDEFNSSAIRNYSLQDGLKGMDFILNSVLLDSKNRIWWGSSKSLTILDLNKFKIPVDPPDMQLNNIEINEQYVDFNNLNDRIELKMEFNNVAKFYNYPLNLELPYKNNHLTFHFSAIDWSAPHKIKFSFKMEGFNDNWSVPSNETIADYRQLPYGIYTFKVRAIGGAQKWSESFEYSFTINPPWWNTWFARTGYGIITLLIILGFVRWRTAKLKQTQKELEAEVVHATLQIREQKEEIETQRDEVVATNEALENQKRELEFTVENLKMTQSQLIQSEKMASVGVLTAGIAHELNNPLNFVSGNVKPLLRDINDIFAVIDKYEQIIKSNKFEGSFNEIDDLKGKMEYSILIKEIIHLLEGIEEGANRSSQIVKGLRSFSRLDDENFQLYDIHDGLDSSLVLLQNKIKGRITIRKDYGELTEIECFPSKLNQVFLNILTNGIQAIEDKGEIFIQTVMSGIGIKIIIKDNGIGMTPEVKKHVFEPFFTTKEVGQGTGLGLSISYGIIEQHNGNIDVISEPGKGTEFILSLPITQSEQH